jgi:hypothetical protein
MAWSLCNCRSRLVLARKRCVRFLISRVGDCRGRPAMMLVWSSALRKKRGLGRLPELDMAHIGGSHGENLSLLMDIPRTLQSPVFWPICRGHEAYIAALHLVVCPHLPCENALPSLPRTSSWSITEKNSKPHGTKLSFFPSSLSTRSHTAEIVLSPEIEQDTRSGGLSGPWFPGTSHPFVRWVRRHSKGRAAMCNSRWSRGLLEREWRGREIEGGRGRGPL